MKISLILPLLLLFTPLFSLPKPLLERQILLGKETLTVEIADTPSSRTQGLMGRETLQKGRGMLFVYPHPERLSFWMKNTLIPLSIAFFDREKTLLALFDMDPPPKEMVHPPIYQSPSPALYALEVPQGWFEEQGISPGMKFTFLDRSDPVK